MAYRVVHTTKYTYESNVSASYGLVYLLPRSTDAQRVVSARLSISPDPDSYSEHDDFFGNRVANFAVLQGHVELTVTTSSLVDVTERPIPQPGSGPTWEEAREVLQTDLGDDVIEARQYVLDSPSVAVSDAVRRFAAPSFTPERALIDVLRDLTGRIHREFRYKPGVTDLATTPDRLLELGAGVCQDFAHLQIACLRSFGLAARYVSGYLETIPPPGKAKLRGADVSHAWVSAFLPGHGWIDTDPTNDVFVGARHICTAWGRDFGDVSPLKGVIFTEAKSNTMTVSVDVTAE